MSTVQDQINKLNEVMPNFQVCQKSDDRFDLTSNDSQFYYTVDFNNQIITAELVEYNLEERFLIEWFKDHEKIGFLKIADKIANKFNDYNYKTLFKGKAKCHEKDTFDISFGIKLARFRALKKLYKERARLATDLTDISADIFLFYTQKYGKYRDKINNYDRIIKELDIY